VAAEPSAAQATSSGRQVIRRRNVLISVSSYFWGSQDLA